MSMYLTSLALKQIAESIEKLEAADLNITSMIVSGHTVLLRRSDSQFDGVVYHVLGITQDGIADEHLIKIGKTSR